MDSYAVSYQYDVTNRITKLSLLIYKNRRCIRAMDPLMLSALASQQETQKDSDHMRELGKRKKEREPSTRLEWIGGAVALICWFLIVIFSKLSALILAWGVFVSILNLTVFWSRRNGISLFGLLMGIGILICVYLDRIYAGP